MHGFSEGIFNHLTLVVPGRSDRYYQIPFGMHWSEVTASSFMEVGIDDGKVKRGEGEVERSCYCIHAPIHKALPQAKAVFHTHMPYASALTRLEDPRIKEIGQTEVGMSGEIAYDDEYTGPALDPAEGARLAGVIGDKTVLFMANHGISTVGATVAEAYDRLYYVERAAQVQIYAMWTGQPLKKLPDAGGREDQAGYRWQSFVQRADPGPATLRCIEADARPEGAGLRFVVRRLVASAPLARGSRLGRRAGSHDAGSPACSARGSSAIRSGRGSVFSMVLAVWPGPESGMSPSTGVRDPAQQAQATLELLRSRRYGRPDPATPEIPRDSIRRQGSGPSAQNLQNLPRFGMARGRAARRVPRQR